MNITEYYVVVIIHKQHNNRYSYGRELIRTPKYRKKEVISLE